MKYFLYIFFIIYAVLLIVNIRSLVLDKGHPLKTSAWLLIMIMLPIFGMGLFRLLGVNYRKSKLFRTKRTLDAITAVSFLNSEKSDLDGLDSFATRQLTTLIEGNSPFRLSWNNKVDILENASEKYPFLIRDIRAAKESIHMTYYILEDGRILDQIVELLVIKARQGVKVRIIYDDIGSWALSKKVINKLKDENIQIGVFMPVRIYKLAQRLNYRNHRKIVVLDNKIAYIGGLNISDKYTDGLKNIGIWRDTHIRLEGDIAIQLQFIFLSDWLFTTKENLFDEYKEMPSTLKRCSPGIITASGPDSKFPQIKQSFFTIVSNAQKYIYISTPYFLPNENILFALQTVAQSGIDVRVLIPYESDSFLPKWSVHSFIEELLERGIRVIFYKEGFLHSKILICDDIISCIGTANLDERSFEYNFEVNFTAFDQSICKKLKDQFFLDCKGGEELTLDQFRKRPKSHKVKESFARLFSPLM